MCSYIISIKKYFKNILSMSYIMTSTINNTSTVSRALLQYNKHLAAVSVYQKTNKEKLNFKNRRNYQRMKEREPDKYRNMLDLKKTKYHENKLSKPVETVYTPTVLNTETVENSS